MVTVVVAVFLANTPWPADSEELARMKVTGELQNVTARFTPKSYEWAMRVQASVSHPRSPQPTSIRGHPAGLLAMTNRCPPLHLIIPLTLPFSSVLLLAELNGKPPKSQFFFAFQDFHFRIFAPGQILVTWTAPLLRWGVPPPFWTVWGSNGSSCPYAGSDNTS